MEKIKLIVDKRELEIAELTKKKNSVEDEVFSEFCKQINVQNIRQYEEKELQAQQERGKKRLEFENQINRLVSQLEYENSREKTGILLLL